jgi:hypothetical protein
MLTGLKRGIWLSRLHFLYICVDKISFTINYMSEINKEWYSNGIQALEGMEHVRMRPSLYGGDVGSSRTSFSL